MEGHTFIGNTCSSCGASKVAANFFKWECKVSSPHTFIGNTCQVCGLSRKAVSFFRWKCQPVEKYLRCYFCETLNRPPAINNQQLDIICGKCKKPLFNTNASNENDITSIIGLEIVKNYIHFKFC
jgi:hypothetical protein